MDSQSQTHGRATVSIVRAENYSLGELVPAVRRGLELVGGLSSLRPGARVFVKINHLSPASPAERGIVTHPVFVEALLALLKERDLVITVGDDIEEDGEDGFGVSGFRDMCERAGVRLVNLRHHGYTEKECRGGVLQSVFLSNVVLDSDAIINVPKLKTHSSTLFTGAIKNMYGVIPVALRRRFHDQYLRTDDFCQVLVDIFSAAQPRLTLMDGVVAMEGEGPGSGPLRKLGIVLAGEDGVALDSVASRVIGLKSEQVLTSRCAGKRGVGVCLDDRIDILGEDLTSVEVSDFRLPVNLSRAAVDRAPRWLAIFMERQISARPRVQEEKCRTCGECVKACPIGAVTLSTRTAVIDSDRCIRCMCCHEVCRFDGIVPHRSLAGQLVLALIGVVKGRGT